LFDWDHPTLMTCRTSQTANENWALGILLFTPVRGSLVLKIKGKRWKVRANTNKKYEKKKKGPRRPQQVSKPGNSNKAVGVFGLAKEQFVKPSGGGKKKKRGTTGIARKSAGDKKTT